MIIPITLSDVELAALQGDAIGPEGLEDVIHRLINPLVERLVSTQLDNLRHQYETLPLTDKVSLITDLQALAVARKKV